MPTISVIIPAYNSEKTIQQTIESVLNQTFSDFELLVINDGSQDSTLEIVSKIKDPRLQVFSYPNAGVAASRNRGFSHSDGEFVSFLDADDLWTPDKLEFQLKALQENPQAGVAYSWMDCIDESNQFLRPGSHVTANGDVYAQLFLTCFVESGSNPLIRRQAFIDVGGYDESLAASQDLDFYLRLAARYHYVAVPLPQVLYRVSNQSMSTNFRRLEATSLLVRNRAFNQSIKPLSPSLKRHSIANFYKYLTFRVLELSPNPLRGFEALRLLWNAVRHDPELLKTQAIKKVLAKIVTMIILPPKMAQDLIEKKKRFYDVNTIFVHYKKFLSEI
jgi:glycosyltransferase involved in cell wall biosynthesis